LERENDLRFGLVIYIIFLKDFGFKLMIRFEICPSQLCNHWCCGSDKSKLLLTFSFHLSEVLQVWLVAMLPLKALSAISTSLLGLVKIHQQMLPSKQHNYENKHTLVNKLLAIIKPNT